MQTDSRVEEGVVDLLRSADLQDAMAELAEAGIDQLLQEGFLRDVAVLGFVVGVIRTAGSVRDLLLAKKLGRFLLALQSVPLNERQAFHDSLSDRADRRRVGEALLLLLDRLDDMEKPALVAQLFRALIRGEIDRATFRQMATAVDRLLLTHIAPLVAFYSSGERSAPRAASDVFQALSMAGLVRVKARGNGGGLFDPQLAGAVIDYSRNELGERFVKILTHSSASDVAGSHSDRRR